MAAATPAAPAAAAQPTQQQAQLPLSVVSDYGEHGSSCGYCGSKRDSSVSHGMMAESLSCEAYQQLIDRGWRRSGCWERSCCQLLTIRMDATQFVPSKEQRRVQRRWDAYLAGAPLRASEQQPMDADTQPGQQQQQQPQEQQQKPQQSATGGGSESRVAAALGAALQAAVAAEALPAAAYPAPRVQAPSAKQRKALPAGVTLTTAFPLAVAGAAAKAQAAGGDGARPTADAVAALLVQHLPLELAVAAQAAKGHLNFQLPSAAPAAAAAAAAAGPGSQQLQQQQPGEAHGKQQQGKAQGKQQQQQQQGPAAAGAAAAGGVPRGPPHVFELRTLPSSDPSLVDVEFPLFKKYQVSHHGDKPSETTPRSFRRFLIDSPLVAQRPDAFPEGGCPPTGYGSFHQQYWLDGRLVAVGVVDVLPRCLSSVYLFWDPDLAPLSLGKLTSLAEIGWVRGVQAACPALRYYYLGFYVHNCHRMRYKGDFGPADLLCPLGKCWVPLARCAAALEQPGLVPISRLPGALEGLGPQHLVDPASHQPAAPPRPPTEEELAAVKTRLVLPGPRGGQQACVVPIGKLQAMGMLRGGGAPLLAAVSKWWMRVGPGAAAHTVYALE